MGTLKCGAILEGNKDPPWQILIDLTYHFSKGHLPGKQDK